MFPTTLSSPRSCALCVPRVCTALSACCKHPKALGKKLSSLVLQAALPCCKQHVFHVQTAEPPPPTLHIMAGKEQSQSYSAAAAAPCLVLSRSLQILNCCRAVLVSPGGKECFLLGL